MQGGQAGGRVSEDRGAGRSTLKRTLGGSFDPKYNSLNFLRLVLATCVLVSHAAGLGGDWEVIDNQTSLAQVSLCGFFGISGFLLAASAMNSPGPTYLWRRFLRIFPGLVACLTVTAFGIALLAWYHDPHAGCSVACYLTAKDSPFLYVLKNALLHNPYLRQTTIAGTPSIAFHDWNTSIWTLFYEFICYLILLFTAVVGFLRLRVVTLSATVILWFTVLVITITPGLSAHFSLTHFVNLESFMRLSMIFFTGTTLYLYKERIPDSGWLALGCAGLYLAGITLPTGGRIPTYQFTPADIFVVLSVYPVLWLGCHLPFQRVGAKNDYSYGIYIYGWPVTTLLLTYNAQHLGPVLYLALCFAATLPFAVASWWLIEKRAMLLKRVEWWRPRNNSLRPLGLSWNPVAQDLGVLEPKSASPPNS